MSARRGATRASVGYLHLLAFCIPVSLQCLLPARAASSCAVVDLMPEFWQALEASDVDAQLHKNVIDPHPDLYNPNYVSLPTGAQWESRLAREKAYDQEHRQEIVAAERYLVANVPGYMEDFTRTFPDYRCDYPFYIAPSFGYADGSAGTANGQHRIIFAPDVIPRVTGEFGASDEAIPPTEVALWGEGLATFVSWRMNPDVTLDTALLQPGIPAGAQPHLARSALHTAIVAELRKLGG